MRHILFALLVTAGLVSVAVGVAMAFVSPWLSDGNTMTIPCCGTIAPDGAESEADEGLTAAYVDERGYLPIIAGAGLLSVAFLGRWRKTN